MDVYAPYRARVAAKLEEWRQGTIVLIRTMETAGDPATPWVPGAATLESYELDAVARGVTAQMADGTTVRSSDIMVVAAAGAVVPQLGDLVGIDGQAHEIRSITPRPAAGTPAAYAIVVAGVAARPLE